MSSVSKSASKTESLPGDASMDHGLIQPIPDIGSLLLNSLEARWNAFVDEALKSSERPTGKAIHDLRVAIRRLIALIEMIKPIIVKNNRPKILKEAQGSPQVA